MYDSTLLPCLLNLHAIALKKKFYRTFKCKEWKDNGIVFVKCSKNVKNKKKARET